MVFVLTLNRMKRREGMTHSFTCFHGNGREEGRVGESVCVCVHMRIPTTDRSWEKKERKQGKMKRNTGIRCCSFPVCTP